MIKLPSYLSFAYNSHSIPSPVDFQTSYIYRIKNWYHNCFYLWHGDKAENQLITFIISPLFNIQEVLNINKKNVKKNTVFFKVQ